MYLTTCAHLSVASCKYYTSEMTREHACRGSRISLAGVTSRPSAKSPQQKAHAHSAPHWRRPLSVRPGAGYQTGFVAPSSCAGAGTRLPRRREAELLPCGTPSLTHLGAPGRVRKDTGRSGWRRPPPRGVRRRRAGGLAARRSAEPS